MKLEIALVCCLIALTALAPVAEAGAGSLDCPVPYLADVVGWTGKCVNSGISTAGRLIRDMA